MSGASVSSFASSADRSSARSQPRGPSFEDGDIFEEPQTLQLGIFGVLYTVSKEKELTSVGFAFFRLFLDFLQLWLLVVNPTYGWAIDPDNKAWQVVSFIQLNSFLSDRGYSFFLAFLYVFIGLLAINLALSIWVANAFSNNRFEYVWPIQFLRWFGLIFYQVLDIATLTLLLVTLDCNYFNVSDAVQFHNQEFPDIMCWSMPHIIHVGTSVVSIIVFAIMATCQVVSEMELNPLTRNYMGIPHTSVEGWGFAIKVVVTIASVTIATSIKLLAAVYLVFFASLFYLAVRWVPFVYSALNYVRCASYATVLYSAMLFLILAFGSPGNKDQRSVFRERVTWAMWAGMLPAACLGALACHLRLRHFRVTVLSRFRNAEPRSSAKAVYRFTDAREVEIAARCCRRWVDPNGETLDPEAVVLSEAVIKAGMMQLPQDPRMIILYSSFLIDVQGSYQSGYTQLQTAKKQSPGLLERFAIFSREQAHTQKASGANNGGADSAVDLVSYVEFQRNHRLVVRAHREALLAMRSFWGLLLRHHVGFNHLSRALHRIEVSVKAAERAYRGVLARHGSSARLVRLYGRFLETVKFDPWAASKWYTEADRLEEEAELTREALQLGGMENLLPQTGGANQSMAEMDGVAFICINAKGIIQVASPEAHALLGYAKNELKGRDVGIIMPPPFGERHSAYVRNYIQTGHASLLDRTSDMVVLTKSLQVLRVRMRVSKVSGLNEDSVFLGVLEAVPPSRDEARAWVMANGTLVAADERFCDWLGYEGVELAGVQLENLVLEKDAVREVIKGFSRTHAAAYAATTPMHRMGPRRPSMNFNPTGESDWDDRPNGNNNGLAGGANGAGTGNEKGMEKSVGNGGGTYSKANTSDFKLSWLRRNDNGNDNTSATGASMAAAIAPHLPVVLPRTAWRHKYTEPLGFDTRLQPGGFGSVKVHSVILRRCPAPPAGSSDSQVGTGLRWALDVPAGRPSSNPHNLPTLTSPPRCRYEYNDLLMVADIKGRLLHVTSALATALGGTPDSIRLGGLGMLIPEPANALHGPWLLELGNPMSTVLSTLATAPPYSCRSGVAVCLATHNPQTGPGVKPFRLTVSQRLADGGGSKVHVVSLKPLTMEQAVSERRLSLTVDLTGTILSANTDSPPQLFGADPRVLAGTCIAQLVDLFGLDAAEQAAAESGLQHCSSRAGAGASGSSGLPHRSNGPLFLSSTRGGDAPEAQSMSARRCMTRALLELARRSSESPGCSWRVGVHVPPSEAARRQLAQLAALLGPEDAALAAQFQTAKTVPAVMTVRLVQGEVPQQAVTTAAPPAPTSIASSAGYGPSVGGAARAGYGTGGVWAQAKDAASWSSPWSKRGKGGPIAEATEPAGTSPHTSLLNAEDEATLKELAEALGPAPPPAPQFHAVAPATPPSVPVSVGAVALTTDAAAAAVTLTEGSPRRSRASMDTAPSLPLPPRVAPSEVEVSSTPRSNAPSAGANQGGHAHLTLPDSPRPAERISRMLGQAFSHDNSPESMNRREHTARQGGSGYGLSKPVSLRLPPDDAAAVAKAAAMMGMGRDEDEDEEEEQGRGAPSAVTSPGLVLEVELWRADLLTGVLEVDDRGRVLRTDTSNPLCRADLVLGTSTAALLGSSVSSSIPLPPGGVTALLEYSPNDPSSTGMTTVRGALKKRNSKPAKAGAPLVLGTRHQGDACGLSLQVQAVRRAGPSGSAFLVVRPSIPSAVQPGFLRWLYQGDTSGLMSTPRAAAHHGGGGSSGGEGRIPMQAVASGRSTGQGGLEIGVNGGRVKSVSGSRDVSVTEHARQSMIGGGGDGSAHYGGADGKQPYGTVYTATASGIKSSAMAGQGAAAAGPSLGSTPQGAHTTPPAPAKGGAAPSPGLKCTPHRLSFTSAQVPHTSSTDNESGGSGDSAGVQKCDTGLSSTVQDTAYEGPVRPQPNLGWGEAGAHRYPSLNRQMSSDELAVVEASAGVRASPRLDEELPLVQGDIGPRSSVARAAVSASSPVPLQKRSASRLSTKKHNMVQSWVISGNSPHRNGAGRQEEDAVEGSDGGSEPDSAPGTESGAGDNSTAEGSSSESSKAGGGGGKARAGAGDDKSGESRDDDGEVESEAGAIVANYSVGKRFKKLYKILTSPLAQQPSRRLRWHTVGAVLSILAAHTLTFVLLLTQLLQQQQAVEDLNSAAMACAQIHEIVTHGRVLEALYAGNSYVQGVPQFGAPVNESIAWTYDALSPLLVSFQDLHRGVYAGFSKRRRIPTAFGLRDIWDRANLNVTLYYDANDPADPSRILPTAVAPNSSIVKLGLWDAGNLFLTMGLDMHNRGPTVVSQGANFSTWSTWLFIEANGLSVLFTAYGNTLDSLVQLTVSKSKDIYILQLIVLCLEGGMLCMAICTYMFYMAEKFTKWRYSLYGVLIQIPIGVIRGLANMSLKLEDNDEDDEDEHAHLHHVLSADHGGALHAMHAMHGAEEEGENGGVLTDGALRSAANGHAHGGGSGHMHGGDALGKRPVNHRRRASTLMFAVDGGPGSGAPGDEERGGGGGSMGPGQGPADGSRSSRFAAMTSAFGSFAFWRGRAKISPQATKPGHHKHKRQLLPSQRLAITLLAPFILWGLAVIAINLWGYADLKAMTAPIATLNVVNAVLVRVHRMLFVILDVAASVNLERRAMLKSYLYSEVSALKLEYSAMLYGYQAVAGVTESSHFELAKSGVVFGGFDGPYELLYDTGNCLCQKPADCQPTNSTLYEITRSGLNVMLMAVFKYADALVVQPVENSGLNSTEFRALWTVGRTDVAGGMSKMSSLFLNEVQGSYNKVVVQQIVMFCIAWVWGLAFLVLQLRPLLRRTRSEMRRIAELLSQLPGEVDCEALVMAVILGQQGAHAQPGMAGRKGGLGGNGGGGGGAGGGVLPSGLPGAAFGSVKIAGQLADYGRTKSVAARRVSASMDLLGGSAPAAVGSGTQRLSAMGYGKPAELGAGKEG